MIPSFDLPKICSNKKCQKVMDVARPGWTCEDGRVAELCNGCFVAFSVGKFCELYHENSSNWKHCTSCKKRIHDGCIAAKCFYVPSKPRGIKCLDCSREVVLASPALRSNLEGTNGKSTSKTAASGPVTPSGVRDLQRQLIARGHVSSPPLGEGIGQEPATPSPVPLTRVPLTSEAQHQGIDKEKVSEYGCQQPTPQPTPQPLLLKNTNKKSSTEAETRTPKPRNTEHRYVPRLTDHELKMMSKGSNVKVTPLFEKILTVSDTGKIGRLVLPKICAEGHFPSINIPEGQPVVIQDLEGKDWEFNFRYWPNNNSRMYVLEGFNYYVHVMELQAGDTVMFAKLEPGAKLVMGHRKGTRASSSSKVGLLRKDTASSPSSRKAHLEKITASNGDRILKEKITPAKISTFNQEKQNDLIRVHSDVVSPKASILAKRKRGEMGMVTQSTSNGILKHKSTPAVLSKVSGENTNDPISLHSDVVGSKSSIRSKRNTCQLGMLTASTSKRISKARTTRNSMVSDKNPNEPISVWSNVVGPEIPNRTRNHVHMGLNVKSTHHEDKMACLGVTFEGGQELIRSRPGSNPPSRMVVEGVELKSYKDDPIIGRPSMFTKHDQESVQWAQCEKCYKWRKAPVAAKRPANWTCRQNQWDTLRSRCSVTEELTRHMVKNIFLANNEGPSKKIKTGNLEPVSVGTVEERIVVATTAIENAIVLPESPKVSKKHPRHRPGCTCIVCMQAPSGTKHKPSCECYACAKPRHRRVLRPRRGKKHSKSAHRKPKNTKISNSKQKVPTQVHENNEKVLDIRSSDSNLQMVLVNSGLENEQNTKRSSDLQVKQTFDLNLLPEPDEDDVDTVVPVLEIHQQ